MEFIDLKTQYRQIREDVATRISRVLEHGRYIMGPEVEELESRLAAFVGSRHCIGVSSGSDALLIAMMALDIGPGDEVITTPFTFIATAEMVAVLGATPVFVDIDPATYNIDPQRIEEAITPRTRAILPVDLYGQCADMEAIDAIARSHGLPVIEDAAQSFGATRHGRHACALSTIGCTSFFPSKPLGGYGDGGACFTDDDDLAERMREIRNHGQDRRYHHARLGLNGRLDTLQAAILLAKLDRFPDEIRRRQEVASRYTTLFAERGADSSAKPDSGASLLTPYLDPANTSVFAQYTIQVDARDRVIEALQRQGIPTAVHYPVTLDRQPAITGRCRSHDLTHAHRLQSRVMSLPMHPYLESGEAERIVRAVAAALSPSSATKENAP